MSSAVMKKIHIVLDGLDGNVEIVRGRLVSERHAMYVDENALWLVHVAPTSMPAVYTNARGSVQLGTTERGEVVIGEMNDKLRAMTAFDFVCRYVLPEGFDIEFDLLRDGLFEGTL